MAFSASIEKLIEEFEKLLASGCQDPESVRQSLLQKAEADRQKRIEQIEADFRTCELIRYGLTLPRESPAYAVSKGIVTWYRKKYPIDNTLARELRKASWAIDHDIIERSRNDERNQGKQAETSGCGNN